MIRIYSLGHRKILDHAHCISSSFSHPNRDIRDGVLGNPLGTCQSSLILCAHVLAQSILQDRLLGSGAGSSTESETRHIEEFVS